MNSNEINFFSFLYNSQVDSQLQPQHKSYQNSDSKDDNFTNIPIKEDINPYEFGANTVPDTHPYVSITNEKQTIDACSFVESSVIETTSTQQHDIINENPYEVCSDLKIVPQTSHDQKVGVAKPSAKPTVATKNDMSDDVKATSVKTQGQEISKKYETHNARATSYEQKSALIADEERNHLDAKAHSQTLISNAAGDDRPNAIYAKLDKTKKVSAEFESELNVDAQPSDIYAVVQKSGKKRKS